MAIPDVVSVDAAADILHCTVTNIKFLIQNNRLKRWEQAPRVGERQEIWILCDSLIEECRRRKIEPPKNPPIEPLPKPAKDVTRPSVTEAVDTASERGIELATHEVIRGSEAAKALHCTTENITLLCRKGYLRRWDEAPLINPKLRELWVYRDSLLAECERRKVYPSGVTPGKEITYGIRQAAAMVGMSHKTLETHLRKGKFPSVMVKGRRLVPESSVGLIREFRKRMDMITKADSMAKAREALANQRISAQSPDNPPIDPNIPPTHELFWATLANAEVVSAAQVLAREASHRRERLNAERDLARSRYEARLAELDAQERELVALDSLTAGSRLQQALDRIATLEAELDEATKPKLPSVSSDTITASVTPNGNKPQVIEKAVPKAEATFPS